MTRTKKILAAVILTPIVLVVGLFVAGFVLTLTGHMNPDDFTEVPEPESHAEQVVEPEPLPQVEAIDSSKPDPSLPSTMVTAPALPGSMDANTVQRWFAEQRLVRIENEVLVPAWEHMAAFTAADAIAVHRALRKGGRDFQPMRMLAFAGFSALPAEARRTFADEVGAVIPVKGTRVAEFTGMFFMQDDDNAAVYARAIRAYCEVLSSREVIDALDDFGAIQINLATDQWTIRVDTKLKGLDASTLMAIHDAIDDQFLAGERKNLRAELRDLAETR